MALVFTAEEVTKLFTEVGKQIEDRAREMDNHDARSAMNEIAFVLQHSMDWDWVIKQQKETQ